jgi:hypothetical protein
MKIADEARACLDQYEKGLMSLERLVSRLEQLQSADTQHSEAWQRDYFQEWMALEQINAVVLDETRLDKSLTQSEVEVVNQAIERLRDLLAQNGAI